MTTEAIAALPVARLAAEDGAHLYLCTINRYVEAAYLVARAWGFTPSTLLVWAKSTMGTGLGGTFGLSSEFVLFCRRGTLAALRREPASWWQWKRPYDERGKPRHSAKPPELYAMIEEVSPGPRVELFARAERPGWDRWGNEVRCSEITVQQLAGAFHAPCSQYQMTTTPPTTAATSGPQPGRRVGSG